jgi:hypothetical protein
VYWKKQDNIFMEKVYHLDLQTLVDYLQGQSAILQTPVEVPHLREVAKGFLFLKEGTLLGCLIQSQDGSILHFGTEALALMQAKKQWQVRMYPDVEHVLRALMQQGGLEGGGDPQPSPAFSQIPRPVRPLEAQVLNGYTQQQRLVLRLVFTMANGERTIEHIKAQLHLPPSVVEEALTTLRALGVLE